MRKPLDSYYWRKWRAAHPEYRERSNRLRAIRRRLKGREDRSAEYRTRKAKQAKIDTTPLPLLFSGHPLFIAALALTGRAWYGEKLYDPNKEDEAAEAVLAMLEGRDPKAAIHIYRRSEYIWKLHRTTIPINL